MPDYQRFISYLYEYKNNHKTHNRGFIKVESRNQILKLEIHITDSSLTSGIPIEVFGYIRKNDTLYGVLLGTVFSDTASVHCKLETDIKELSQLKGIIILCSHIFSYASAWDDIPIEPQHFTLADSEEPQLTVEEIPNQQSEKSSEYREVFEPFTDGFITECTKICSKDHLPMGSNPFLTVAYDKYQHFITGQIHSANQQHRIFGVPGSYTPKEKFMAERYGFPYFKATAASFGYWYRILD